MESIPHHDDGRHYEERQAEKDAAFLEDVQEQIADEHATELALDNRDDARIRRYEAESLKDSCDRGIA